MREKKVYDAAKKEWETITAEVDEVPDFDDAYTLVQRFYESLPWRPIGAKI
ncbi:hypothetical protein [Magnetococcus marinus]|uniref:hypothetical protein n=1 Tax=Magnetococcus marinus TaxID=1124597 RepID=UPI00005434F0|nr:hypothetical protein [Magnetococcus marinus]